MPESFPLRAETLYSLERREARRQPDKCLFTTEKEEFFPHKLCHYNPVDMRGSC
jgi:hypothetical protein